MKFIHVNPKNNKWNKWSNCYQLEKLSENHCVSLITKCINLYQLEEIALSLTKLSPNHLNQSVFVKTALINGFAKYSNNISKCSSLFNSIPNDKKDLVITCSMMDAFMKFRHFDNALSLYDITDKHDISINNNEKKLSYFYNLAIKVCKNINNIKKAKEIHSFLKESYPILYQNRYINTSLISFYGNIKDTSSALIVFNDNINMNNFNVSSLNAIMTILIDNDENEIALSLYQKFFNQYMENHYDDITHLLAVKTCINMNNYKIGKQIVNKINEQYHQHHHSIKLQNTIMDFYGYFRKIDDALNVFNTINNCKKTTVVSLNVILKTLINGERNKTALSLYTKHGPLLLLNDDNINITDITTAHLLAIKACINENKLKIGKKIINKYATKFGKDIKNELYIKSTLIDFYGHFNEIQDALNVFNSISNNLVSVVIINCIIKALIDNNLNENALSIYDEYQSQIQYDNVTHILAIKACANLYDIERGKQIHQNHLNEYLFGTKQSNNKNLSRNDVNIMISTLINLYDKCDDVDSALIVFRKYFIQQKDINKDMLDIITLNSILNMYLNHNMYHECITLFQIIVNKRVIQNKKNLLKDMLNLYSIAINSCKDGMFLEKGKEIHHMIESNKKIFNKLGNVQINFINMYGKGS